MFATMWANQASSSEGPAPSIAEGSIKHEISGYILDTFPIDELLTTQHEEVTEPSIEPVSETTKPTPSVHVIEEAHALEQASPEELPVAEPEPDVESDITPETPAQNPAPEPEVHEAEAVIHSPTPISSPIAFPSSAVAFPTSGDSQSEIHRVETPASAPPVQIPTPTPGPAVTFGVSVNSPPSRTGTPDPDSEPKRKRISSQNFQRLARRISLTTRRSNTSSSIIAGLPGFKRDQSPRVSTDDANSRGEGSNTGASNDSPAGSVTGSGDDSKGKLKKKDKKDKKDKTRKGTL